MIVGTLARICGNQVVSHQRECGSCRRAWLVPANWICQPCNGASYCPFPGGSVAQEFANEVQLLAERFQYSLREP